MRDLYKQIFADAILGDRLNGNEATLSTSRKYESIGEYELKDYVSI